MNKVTITASGVPAFFSKTNLHIYFSIFFLYIALREFYNQSQIEAVFRALLCCRYIIKELSMLLAVRISSYGRTWKA